MKKRSLIPSVIIMMALGWNMTICAQPVTLEDGTVFDAEFYARTYPDVAAAYGTDAALLYQHYVRYGKAEGRMATDPSPAQEEPSVPIQALSVKDLTNVYRQTAGISPLSWDDTLSQAASLRAQETSVLFSHTRPNGASCFTALPSVHQYRTLGENIAAGYSSPEAVTTGWMDSEGHRANMMDPSFKRIGVGYFVDGNGYPYWVQLFAG